MKWMMLPLVLLSSWVLPSWSHAIEPAAGCTKAQIEDAVNLADVDEVVTIPAGTCTLTAAIVITKNVTLQGFAAIPVATDSATAEAVYQKCIEPNQVMYTCLMRGGQVFHWRDTTSGTQIFKNIAVIGLAGGGTGTGCIPYGNGNTTFSGQSAGVRITGSYFRAIGSCWGIVIGAGVTGVADHNTFYQQDCCTHAIVVVHPRWLNASTLDLAGDKSWASPLTLGAAGAFYIEDNVFVPLASQLAVADIYYTDHYLGARYVMRFNTVIHGSFQTHGTESGGRSRGPVQAEYYRNYFPFGTTSGPTSTQIAHRGVGTAYSFDNVATGNMTRVVEMNTYRAGPVQGKVTFYPWANCGKHPIDLTVSGTTVTGVLSDDGWSGLSSSKAYIDIVGAGAPYDNVVGTVGATTWKASPVSVAIDHSTTGNPTEFTTTTAHNFSDGQYVRVNNVVGIVPNINVSSSSAPAINFDHPGYPITVTGATTFTIALTTTGAGTGGTASNRAMLTYTLPASSSAAPSSGTYQATYDGNTDNAGYPCLDQVGAGPGDLLSGTGPVDGDTMKNATTGLPGHLHQPSSPHYCWNNTDDDDAYDNQLTGGVSKCLNSTGAAAVIEFRDFYNFYATFDGDTVHGIGRGTRASRPAVCTTGDAWFSTNDATNWNTSSTETYSARVPGIGGVGFLSSGADGALDKCTSTDTWTNAAYVPYTYPHPLTNPPVAPPPDAPTGLHIAGLHTGNSLCLAWDAITLTNLGGYHIYHGMASGAYTEVFNSLINSVATSHKPATQYCYASPVGGTHYFSVSAHTIYGVDTSLATEVSATFTALSRATATARSGR